MPQANLTPAQVAQAGQPGSPYWWGQGNYNGPAPTSSNDPTGDSSNYERVLYGNPQGGGWGTNSWDTWNPDGTYRGSGSGATTASGLAQAGAIAGAGYLASGALAGAGAGTGAAAASPATPFGFGGGAVTPSLAGGGVGAGAGAGAGGALGLSGSTLGQVAGAVGSQLVGAALRPDIPDYQAAATQQGQQNLTAAQIQNQMNRVDTTTPFGSQTFQTIADPSVPGGFRYTSNISLSPQQQGLLDATQQGQLSQLQLSNGMLGRMSDVYSRPFDLGGFGNSERVQAFQGDMVGSPTALGRVGQAGPMATLSPAERQSYERAGPNSLGGYELAQPGAGATPSMFSGGGPQARDLYGQTGYADRVGEVQRSVQEQFRNANATRFSEEIGALDNKLKNMGLAEGTEAYDREMRNLRNAQGQQAMDATQRGVQLAGAEQSRLAGLDLNADQQRFTQQQISQFANPLTTVGFNNAAGQQGYNNLLTALQQRNQARAANQGDTLATLGFNNTAQRTGANDFFDQNRMVVGHNNTATQSNFNNELAGTGFNNEALQRDMQNQLTVAGYNRDTGNQNFANRVTQANTNNTARQNDIATALQMRGLPLAEYNALRQGTAPTTPQFQPFGMGSVQPTPTMAGATAQGAGNLQRSNYNIGTMQQALNLMPWGSLFGGGLNDQSMGVDPSYYLNNMQWGSVPFGFGG